MNWNKENSLVVYDLILINILNKIILNLLNKLKISEKKHKI